MGTLRTKITLIVSVVTSVLMIGSASFEANHLVEQGEALEQENQAVQIANILPSIIDGVWDFDQNRTAMIIKGLFDVRSTRRVQVIDPLGKVYAGASRDIAIGDAEIDLVSGMSEPEAKTPQTEWSEVRIKTLKFTQKNKEKWQVIVPLWQPMPKGSPKFIGHLLVEYSLEESIARSHDMMLRLLFGGLALALLIIVLLSLTLHFFVLRPIQVLMAATQALADGKFDETIALRTNDEMSVLAKSFDSMRIKLRDFTFHLQDLVSQRTRQVEEQKKKIQNILIHINEGIMTIDKDYLVAPEISDQLIKLLDRPREEIIGKNIFELVFGDSTISCNDKDEVKASLDSTIGEDLLGFQTNAGHLPAEITIMRGEGIQILDLDWVPIVDEETACVSHMMLTIRDISEKRLMEQLMIEARETHERYLRIVGDIVHVGVERTRKVFADAQLQVSRLLLSLEAGESVSYNHSFPILHTIKGNLRSLKFGELVEEIHLAEEFVLKQRQGSNLDLAQLAERLTSYLKKSAYYLELIEKVWGESSTGPNGLLFSLLDNLMVETRAVLHREQIEIQCLEVKDEVVEWSQDGLILLSDILMHALSNSLDHGYLRPKSQGLNFGRFSFQVEAKFELDHVHLHLRDGGRGVSFDQLRTLYHSQAKPFDSKQPYKILFENSVSTSQDVTTRSGRGVGLYAIRELVLQNGGEVRANSKENEGFSLNIYLPISKVYRDVEARKRVS